MSCYTQNTQIYSAPTSNGEERITGVSAGSVIKSGKDPCGVCNKGVGSISIKCISCKAWIHKRCSDISGKLQVKRDFHCKTCANGPVQLERLEKISLGFEVARIWTALTNSAIWAT